jgi:hypothetical protein
MQYSYQFPKTFNGLNVFGKAFVNSGFYMSNPVAAIPVAYSPNSYIGTA